MRTLRNANGLAMLNEAQRRYVLEIRRMSYMFEADAIAVHFDFLDRLVDMCLDPPPVCDPWLVIFMACKRRLHFPQGFLPPRIYCIAPDCKASYVYLNALKGTNV